MALNVELPPSVENSYREEARARGLALDDLVRQILITHQPAGSSGVAEGFGLFGNAEDSALLDEVVALAREERRHSSQRI